MEILMAIVGVVSAIGGGATVLGKAIGCIRSYDRQLQDLELGLIEAEGRSNNQRAELAQHLVRLEGMIILMRSEIGLDRSIAASPRGRHSSPIEAVD